MRVKMTRRLVWFAAAVSMALVLVSAAGAQTASIAGTVVDSTDAVVPGAEITARNTATNEAHTATSSATGTFSLTNLQIGPYEITVKRDGFK
ncbi:MAG: carboxypeptidase-like regulatory domain-containing protein, partial [Terriglobales bacterium]